MSEKERRVSNQTTSSSLPETPETILMMVAMIIERKRTLFFMLLLLYPIIRGSTLFSPSKVRRRGNKKKTQEKRKNRDERGMRMLNLLTSFFFLHFLCRVSLGSFTLFSCILLCVSFFSPSPTISAEHLTKNLSLFERESVASL